MNCDMRFRVLAAVLAVPTLALGAPQRPAPGAAPSGPPMTKTPSPCGEKVLPLAVGNTWTYGMVPSVIPVDPKVKVFAPAEADTITITVKSIDTPKGGDTTITLEEKTSTNLQHDHDPKKQPILDERTYTSTITCNAKKFEISPESFFFAGEPGGYLGISIDKIERSKGTSWQLANGDLGDQRWREDVHMAWTRVPSKDTGAKLGSGRIELERQFTPENPEAIETKVGTYTAEKLALVTTGRVYIDGAAANAKLLEIPANWVTTFWITPGAGVVQTVNPYQHMYQLTSATLK